MGRFSASPPPLTVGIDGTYVRDWTDKKTHFEVIVGKSMSQEGSSRCFGSVQTYGPKPKRRLFELGKGQGMLTQPADGDYGHLMRTSTVGGGRPYPRASCGGLTQPNF